MARNPDNPRKPAEPWIVSSFSLRPEMVEKLDEEAARIGIPRSALIRTIIDQYLSKK